MSNYVNPKICIHRWITTKFLYPSSIYAVCQICGLQGEPVKRSWFDWLSRCRATRKFYQMALQIDKEKSNVGRKKSS